MPVRKWGWSPREVSRAIEVVRKAGFAITAVTINGTKGDITVATGTPADSNGVDLWKQTVAELENDQPTSNSKSSKA